MSRTNSALLEIKKQSASLFNHLGFSDAYASMRRGLVKSQVILVNYHRISNQGGDPFQISIQSFERQIEYFHRNYEISSLRKIVQGLLEKKLLPRKAVVITFDDGYKDNYIHAFPVLRKYRIPATIFLATGHISTGKPFWWDSVKYVVQHATIRRIDLGELGNYCLESNRDRSRAYQTILAKLGDLSQQSRILLMRKLIDISRVDLPDDLGNQTMLSWRDVKEMSRNGIDFGAHSVTHPSLTNVPLSRARWEIDRSKRDIEEKIGEAVDFFAYPHGNLNNEIVKIVEETGYTGAVTTCPRWVGLKADVHRLGRFSVGTDLDILRVILCGVLGDLQSIFRAKRTLETRPETL